MNLFIFLNFLLLIRYHINRKGNFYSFPHLVPHLLIFNVSTLMNYLLEMWDQPSYPAHKLKIFTINKVNVAIILRLFKFQLVPPYFAAPRYAAWRGCRPLTNLWTSPKFWPWRRANISTKNIITWNIIPKRLWSSSGISVYCRMAKISPNPNLNFAWAWITGRCGVWNGAHRGVTMWMDQLCGVEGACWQLLDIRCLCIFILYRC